MANAKRPDIALRDKENINPSLVRKNEATDADFHNIYEVLTDHAVKIDGFTGGNTGNQFYGFHGSLEVLAGQHPIVAEDSFAIIEGAPPQIAQFKNGEWFITGTKAPFVFVDNKFQRPNPGVEKVWYIVKDSGKAYLWYDGRYHGFSSGINSSGGDKNTTHEQSTPSSVWTINHNMGKYPSVTIIDSAGSEVEGEVVHTNENSLKIIFGSGFSGIATLN